MTAVRWWQTRTGLVAVVVSTALPLLWPPIPPLTDVPGHMGAYRVMLGTDAATLGQWYRFHWHLIGYLGGEIATMALAPLFGLEPAVKLIVLAIPVLTATGMLWISREAHGRVQPFALFALPFAYNLAVQYGFVNYTLAMAFALNAFALWLRLGRQERIALRAAIFVPLSCAVWLTHLFGWLVLGLLAFCAEVTRQRALGRGWIGCVWHAGIGCVPLALPFLAFLDWRPGGGATSDYWATLHYKPGWLAMALVDRWRLFDVASITLVAGMLYFGLRGRDFRRSPPLAAAAIGMLVLFLVMPFGTAYIDARLMPYLIVVALLAIGVPDDGTAKASRIAAVGIAFFVLRIAAGTASMAIESQDWTRRLAAIDHIPHGARVAVFVTNPCRPGWRLPRLNHLGAMAIVRRAAFTNDEYDLGSTATLEVTAPGVGGFAMDPSEMVTTAPCVPGFRTLTQALQTVPRGRFDDIWLIAPGPLPAAAMRGLVPIWRGDGDVLLRVRPAGLSATGAAH